MKGKRILLVEDEQEVREALRLLLLRDAHTVIEANNGAEAWMLFRGARFDLVMTDFELPFVKGDELAIKIRQLSPRQPIIMITGYCRRPGPANPVDAVVKKPFDSTDLRETLTKVLSPAGRGETVETQGHHSAEDRTSRGYGEAVLPRHRQIIGRQN